MKKPNRLANEKSPYLLQHANNPVNWYPWSQEAFENAKLEDKPIFLSIGYSTCHWCHVMEKESFEDEEIASLMNDAFVSIKVDREERPDIDGIYMTVCQMLTGSGGWPLTIIMTPDKKPFFAGTYFPKDSRFGRPGMKELVPHIKDVWLKRRDEVYRSAGEIIDALNTKGVTVRNDIDETVFEKTFSEFKRKYDPGFGGFGTSPKFPSPHNFYFLLRYFRRSGNREALDMVEKTLTEMRLGGIYDHLGFGFHRYSTDRKWLVPHFEKMLYDQALLATAYTELYQVTRKKFYQDTAEEIFEYVIRDMSSPEGGFYSAEDADSEGIEGKFYLWSKKEIDKILKEDADIISEIFNVKNEGNIPGENLKDNILHLNKTLREISEEKAIDLNTLIAKTGKARKKLFEIREQRIHPFKDDKILTDWNGLMISALAKAAGVFGNKLYEEHAVKAAEFVLTKLRTHDGNLLHRFRNGEAGITANVDDYSFFIAALIDLYEATFDNRWLKTAFRLNEDMIKYFLDEKSGGFFFSPDYGEKLIVRQKEIYDGAVPSGNSVAISNLLKLGKIKGDSSLEEKAFNIVQAFPDQINQMPSAFSSAVSGLDFGYGDSMEIVIIGGSDDKLTKKFIGYFRTNFIPNKIILLKVPGDEDLKGIAPFTEYQTRIDKKTTVYICRNYICEKPVTTLADVKAITG